MPIIGAIQHSKPGSPCSAGGESESTAPGSSRSLSPPIGCGGGVPPSPNTLTTNAANSYHCSESNRLQKRRRFSVVADPGEDGPYHYDHHQFATANDALYQDPSTPLRGPVVGTGGYHQYVQQQSSDADEQQSSGAPQQQSLYYQSSEDYQPYSSNPSNTASTIPNSAPINNSVAGSGSNNCRSGSSATNQPPGSSYPQLYTNQSSAYNSNTTISSDLALCSQKAVAFLPGPRERICVLGSPIEFCPRCRHEGFGSSPWRPHRHVGELKIRYICERYFDDLESNHHFDLPLCPICNSVLYLYEFNAILGLSTTRRLHKYVLKCNSRHVLPLLDLFCQTKKSGEKCNANFKLQWSYGTMVKRCEAQRVSIVNGWRMVVQNRDHDLWWVRYKNEWKQRRTIIRYKKDFLSHLTEAQRGLVLGLGLEGEPPPDPKAALGPTFDALRSSAGNSPQGPKIKKRQTEKMTYALGPPSSSSGALEDAEYDCAFGKRDLYGQVATPRMQGQQQDLVTTTTTAGHHMLAAEHHLGGEHHIGSEHHPCDHICDHQHHHHIGDPHHHHLGQQQTAEHHRLTYGSSVGANPGEGITTSYSGLDVRGGGEEDGYHMAKENIIYGEEDIGATSGGGSRNVSSNINSSTTITGGFVEKNTFYGFPSQFEANQIITGTPMNQLQDVSPTGRSPVAATVYGHILRSNSPDAGDDANTADSVTT